MTPDFGKRVIDEARKQVGAHYINGAYGARPGKEGGCPCRPGMVDLVLSHKRLDPNLNIDREKNVAVYAAQVKFKDDKGNIRFCVCAGNYNAGGGGRLAMPRDKDLTDYLDKLRATPDTERWPYFFGQYSPRRAYGPGPSGDIGGVLVWGEACDNVRHFDCIGFISYCLWKAGGPVHQNSILGWHGTPQPLGGTVYEIGKGARPKELMDGDILIKADHHIGWVSKDGTIIEAQDTDVGVCATKGFSLASPGGWTHLVRLPDNLSVTAQPVPDERRESPQLLESTG
jgi:hypothetical protein